MKRRPLSDAERIDWIRLSRTREIGPVTFHQLMSRHGWNAADVLSRLHEKRTSAGKTRNLIIPPISQIEDEISRADRIGARLIALCEPDYPEPLSAVDSAPPIVTFRGQPQALVPPGIALVGARNASAAGRKMSRDLATDLCREGFAVISGMARGIDGEAHAATLSAGGYTVAILAGGVDAIYPPEHDKLYDKIIEHGAVISERPLGFTATSRDFPKRNRLISGLSVGVVVVEAAKRSGSLISARMALEQGREVMAVPGSPLDQRCAGNNGLIKQGAWLIEDAKDVVNALEGSAPLVLRENQTTMPSVDPIDISTPAPLLDALRTALSPTPVRIDELARVSGFSIRQVQAGLTELELMGEAETHSGGLVSRTAE